MANKNKLMEKAQKFLQKGKLKDTIAVLNQVIEVDPTDYRVLLKKGELEQRVGDNASAKESYTQVAEQYSSDGFYLKAIAIYKKILKLDSEEQEIHSKLALLYRKLGLDSEAKKHLKVAAEYYKAKGFKTNYQEVIAQLSELGETIMDTDSQVSIAEKIVNEEGRDNAVEHLQKISQKAVESGNLSQLEGIVKKMEELQIQDVNVYISHAHAYVAAGEPKKALQVLQRAFAIQPQNPEILELLAKCFQELSQPLKAVSVFNELEKMYDTKGDMKNLTRVKAELLRLMGPIHVEEPIDSKPSYETESKDESEEFVLEEVEFGSSSAPSSNPPPSKSVAPAKEVRPSPSVAPAKVAPVLKTEPLPTHKSIDANAQVNFEDFEDEEESFTRHEEAEPNEVSFMNIFVDAFDGNEETIYQNEKSLEAKVKAENVVKQQPEVKQPSKPAEKTAFRQSPPKPLEESTIFNKSQPSFKASDRETVEATTNDFNEDIFIEEVQEAYDLSSDNAEVNFDDAVHDATVMEGGHAQEKPPELIGFNEFYAGGGKEKSEISVNAEEFVSLDDLEGEGSSPSIQAQSEKIEIHDRVERTVAQTPGKKSPGPIKHDNLHKNPISAEIESSLDFSNLEMSEINLQVPASNEDREFVSSMLDDSDSDLIENQINLDEKTMMDVQHEFKESAKHEPRANSDDNMFDLSSELKDEISEFEKSFGKGDEDLEEEYLSPEEVILEFKKGIARTIDKNDFQTHYSLGVAYKEMGLIDEAISAFELASNNPDSKVDAISMIGICLAIKKDYERAIKLYQQILPTMSYQNPKALGITYQMGEAFLELGRHTDAYKAFAKIKDVDPSFRDVKTRVKELQFNLGIKDDDPKQYAGKMIVDLKERKKNKF